MDETDEPQTPAELLVILGALADEGVPVQTLAPRFSGRFNKGVDYAATRRVLRASSRRTCPRLRRLRSGSSCRQARSSACTPAATSSRCTAPCGRPCGGPAPGYTSRHPARRGSKNWPPWRMRAAKDWTSPGDLRAGLRPRGRLCGPYAAVIDLRRDRLPDPAKVRAWPGDAFAAAVRHDPACPAFNPDLAPAPSRELQDRRQHG